MYSSSGDIAPRVVADLGMFYNLKGGAPSSQGTISNLILSDHFEGHPIPLAGWQGPVDPMVMCPLLQSFAVKWVPWTDTVSYGFRVCLSNTVIPQKVVLDDPVGTKPPSICIDSCQD